MHLAAVLNFTLRLCEPAASASKSAFIKNWSQRNAKAPVQHYQFTCVVPKSQHNTLPNSLNTSWHQLWHIFTDNINCSTGFKKKAPERKHKCVTVNRVIGMFLGFIRRQKRWVYLVSVRCLPDSKKATTQPNKIIIKDTFGGEKKPASCFLWWITHLEPWHFSTCFKCRVERQQIASFEGLKTSPGA